MDMGPSSSPPNSSTDDPSLNGLILGQKIYFEDVSSNNNNVPHHPYSKPVITDGRSSSSSSRSGGGRKVRSGGGVAQSGGGARCQVEGCKVDLSDVKAYYSRHKVCGIHSKTPEVVVNGIKQRFCQQCSRFHQLSEFDNGKRSCRRRLAGHNERRRKPPPGSLLASRYGQFSSSIYDDGTRAGSFMMDFSAYPRLARRDSWGNVRSAEWVTGNQLTGPTRSALQWQSNNSQDPSSDLFLQAGTGFSSPGITQGECFTGVTTDSTCALSLLSNQPWGSRNRPSSINMNDLMDDGISVSHQTTHSSATFNQFANNTSSWGFKLNEAGTGSSLHDEMPPDLGLGQISQQQQSVDSHLSFGLELSHQRRHYMEFEQSRGYDSSTQHVHWSL